MATQHTLKVYDDRLRGLATLVQQMGERVLLELDDALASLLRGDLALARRAIEHDTQVNDLRTRINAEVAIILARQQPVAQDLRDILASGRIAGDLERAGDHAKNVAKRALALGEKPTAGTASQIGRLGAKVRPMLSEVIAAYSARDSARAKAVWISDADLDQIYRELFQYLLEEMQRDPRRIASGTHLLFVAKSLERIGDHATNIAEDVSFMVTGLPVLETRPKLETIMRAPSDT